MAGSFDYKKEHYDISAKIGENILFPAVKSMQEGTPLVANGFSCRHQIEHFTGVKPKHWVEVKGCCGECVAHLRLRCLI